MYLPLANQTTVGLEKVVPVHAMKVPGGAEVKLHSFLTYDLDGEEWLTLRPGRFRTPVPIEQVGWAPEPVWTLWRKEKSLFNRIISHIFRFSEEVIACL
jgi:hypothetical protein